jgi:L-ribulokinase
MAQRLKLAPGIAVCAGNIDAHAGVPACGVTQSGTLAMIMGTSTCHLLISDTREEVEGVCGVVQDGVVPGYWGYEAGQAGVGDLFAWYVEQAVPAKVTAEAARQKLSVHDYLSGQAGKLKPGASGLLALDWWAGNRSVLMDADLTGVILGLTIESRPAEIYRALIEATAFGTRKIVDSFVSRGLAINELIASGGLAQKNPVLMQIYADVLQRPITVAGNEQSSAFGAAMWGAVAAGLYPNIHKASESMVKPSRKIYCPSRSFKKVYDRLYEQYTRLHDAFGRDAASVMRNVRAIQKEATR